MARPYKHWTEQETTQLRQQYGTMPAAELGRRMNRHPDMIIRKARTLDLRSYHPTAVATLEALIKAAGRAGITAAQLATRCNNTSRAVTHTLSRMLALGTAHRHRHGKADLYYSSAEDCCANAAQLKAERLASVKARQEALARERQQAKPTKAAGEKPAPQAKPKTSPKPRKAKGTDARPGTQQIVKLGGTLAPVRVTARGPAYLPGKASIPASLEIQRYEGGQDTRYTPDPKQRSDDNPNFSRLKPGHYSAAQQPSRWAAAAIAGRHGA